MGRRSVFKGLVCSMVDYEISSDGKTGKGGGEGGYVLLLCLCVSQGLDASLGFTSGMVQFK